MTEVLILSFYLPLISLFLLGCIIGSFLGVVGYRLHTGRSVNGHSHCESCGKRLRFFELFPLFSFLFLRGRCAGCGSRMSSQYFFIELSTGLVFLLVGYWFLYSSIFILVLNLVLASLLILVFVYDVRHLIIPNELVWVLSIVAAGLVFVQNYEDIFTVFLPHFWGGIFAGGFYLFLWWFTKGKGLGFGDVKLAVPLGFMVGIYGVASFIILSFWIGAVVSLLFLVTQKLLCQIRYGYSKTNIEKNCRYFTMKSEIPFAPFIITAFGCVFWMNVDVFILTHYVLEKFIAM